MLVLSSPSGAGKTTLSRLLLAREAGLVMSISATTRTARPGEVEGSDYYFVSDADFDRMIRGKELLEFATVFGNRYGTPKKAVFEALESGTDVLFDIDWQGTQQVAQKAQGDLVSIFILPPSTAELERRLTKRAQDSAEVVAERMSEAPLEIVHWAEYDYVLVNDDLESCFKQITNIIAVERLKPTRQSNLVTFVQSLTDIT